MFRAKNKSGVFKNQISKGECWSVEEGDVDVEDEDIDGNYSDRYTE